MFQPLPSRRIVEPFPPEHTVKYHKVRFKLEKRSIIAYHPCIRRILDYWHREYGLVNYKKRDVTKKNVRSQSL